MNRLIMIGTFATVFAVFVFAALGGWTRKEGEARPPVALPIFGFICACLVIVLEAVAFVQHPGYGHGLMIIGNVCLLPALWQKSSGKPAATPPTTASDKP
jgi:hypothetical protein